ncbi:MAG: DUF1592 domain-containing protein [Myxococcales bacterium]|nr:DUF1592 domain-containing protein [Myxococcales bacterium]
MRAFRAGLAVGLALVGCTEAEAPPVLDPLPDVAASDAPLRRLTAEQYAAAVRDVLGEDLVLPSALEPDVPYAGLVALGVARTSVSSWGVEQYEAAAFDLAEQVLADPARRDALVPCSPAGTVDDGCAQAALTALGLKLWRRPVEPAELTALTRVAADAAQTLGDFHQGLEYAVAAMLQSPNFLYRWELGEAGAFGDYALASRISFLLWNTTPDDALLAAAGRGELSTEAGLLAQVERLLASPRARVGVRSFFTELYELYRLDDMVKDPTLFVHYDTELGPAAREETLRVIERLVFEDDGDFRDLMTTTDTFVDRRLAAVYQVRAPVREGFGAVTLPEGERRGLLGQVSTLALHSHPEGSSAVLRGRFVRKVLLCGVIPPPPVNVNTALPEPSAEAPTLRERNRVHLELPECAGCHALMDPIGLGLENFDAVGRHRNKDNGALIDAAGELDGVPFVTPWELAGVVRDHPALPRCLVRNLYRYATGVEESGTEQQLINGLAGRFEAQGYRVKALLRDLATSPAMRRVSEVTP